MDTPRTLFRISIPRWLWGAAAVVVVCLVAGAIAMGMYAGRRAAALRQLHSVKVRAPGSVPVGLYPPRLKRLDLRATGFSTASPAIRWRG